MRRTMLLIVGFGVCFAVLWLLLSNSVTALTCAAVSEPLFQMHAQTGGNDAQKKEQTLPLPVSGTSLIAEQIMLYEGAFLEDSYTQEVVQVAALLIRNTAQWGVERATVVLESGSCTYVFEADSIPPGEAVLVLEKNQSAYGAQTFTACYGTSDCTAEDWSCSETVDIQCVDIGTVTVTNQTKQVLIGIMLYYKNYIADPGFFVGGRSNVHLIERMEPGQTIYIYPLFYAKKYSRFARIEIQDCL